MSRWAEVHHPIPWREGYAAFCAGVSIGSNPYPRTRNEAEAEAWDDGWFDARYDAEDREVVDE